jgi:hypothetical protein
MPAVACQRCRAPLPAGRYCDEICEDLHEVVELLLIAALLKERELAAERAEVRQHSLDDDDNLHVDARVCRICFVRLANGADYCSAHCAHTYAKLMPELQAEDTEADDPSPGRWLPPGRPRRRGPGHRDAAGRLF